MNLKVAHVEATEIIYLFFLPLFIFPLFWFAAAVLSWLYGDVDIPMHILYGSRGLMLREVLSSWLASLPVAAVISWVVISPVYILSAKRKGWMYHPIIVFPLLGFIFSLVIYRFAYAGFLLIPVTGVLLCIVLCVFQRLAWFRARHH